MIVKGGTPEPPVCSESESERGEGSVMSRPRPHWSNASDEECNLAQVSALEEPDPTEIPGRRSIPTVAVSERGRQDCKTQLPDRPVLDESPPRTKAQTVAQTMSNAMYVRKSPDSCVLPGEGDICKMSKLSRLQRIVQRKVATEYGLEFPYVPKDVMEEIERTREEWYREAVWEYLGTPRPYRNKRIDPLFVNKFGTCMDTWKYGRYILKDRVVIKRPNREYHHH